MSSETRTKKPEGLTIEECVEKGINWKDGYKGPQHEYERCMRLPERQRRRDTEDVGNDEISLD